MPGPVSNLNELYRAMGNVQGQMEESKKQREDMNRKLDRIVDTLGDMGTLVGDMQNLKKRVLALETVNLVSNTTKKVHLHWVHFVWGAICLIIGLFSPHLAEKLAGLPSVPGVH